MAVNRRWADLASMGPVGGLYPLYICCMYVCIVQVKMYTRIYIYMLYFNVYMYMYMVCIVHIIHIAEAVGPPSISPTHTQPPPQPPKTRVHHVEKQISTPRSPPPFRVFLCMISYSPPPSPPPPPHWFLVIPCFANLPANYKILAAPPPPTQKKAYVHFLFFILFTPFSPNLTHSFSPGPLLFNFFKFKIEKFFLGGVGDILLS